MNLRHQFKPAQRFRYDPLPPEDVLIAGWEATIKPEHKNLNLKGNSLEYYTLEERKAISDGKKAAQVARQKKFASECTPAIQGDDVLIDLYEEGLTLMQIAKRTGRFQTEVKRRLIACHPTAEKLR